LKASGGATRLCVCVDELLASIPLDALPRGNERVGDAIALHVESSFARLLEPAAAEPAGNPTLLAMGAAELAAVSTTTLPELPAAGPELEAVVRRFHARWADGQATLTTGSAAQKSAFLAAAPSARFLHVATHGWYAFEGASSVLAAPRGTGAWSPSMEASAIRAFAPLTSCGLAFAGTSGASAPDVLTAEELARLDLRQCDLAVLSACETAAGLALGGQSTQSLQAALHAAGARSAITSLWRVSDASARALFEEFYAGLWERGESRSDALWHAKRALRAQGLPPGEWAGWVLSGASR